MTKRIFIIHRWDASPRDDWYPWANQQLTEIGYKVIVPDMPDAYQPRIETWVPYLKESVGEVDQDTHFIGHSIGFQTIVRYLETLEDDQKVGKIVSVAGWFKLTQLAIPTQEEQEVARPWLEKAIDFDKAKKHTQSIHAFLSENDPYVAVSDNLAIYQKLGAKVVIEKDKGHFDEGFEITQLPELVNIFK